MVTVIVSLMASLNMMIMMSILQPRMLESFVKSIRFKFFFMILLVIDLKLGLVMNNELRNNEDRKKDFASLIGHLGVELSLFMVLLLPI